MVHRLSMAPRLQSTKTRLFLYRLFPWSTDSWSVDSFHGHRLSWSVDSSAVPRFVLSPDTFIVHGLLYSPQTCRSIHSLDSPFVTSRLLALFRRRRPASAGTTSRRPPCRPMAHDRWIFLSCDDALSLCYWLEVTPFPRHLSLRTIIE